MVRVGQTRATIYQTPSRGCPAYTVCGTKREAGLSERYLQDLDSRLEEFSRDFQCSIGAVTGPEIRAWLQKKDVCNRTRNNPRVAIQTLFSFSVGQKYLPKEWNEMSAVPTWKTVGEEVEIFTPSEMSTTGTL